MAVAGSRGKKGVSVIYWSLDSYIFVYNGGDNYEYLLRGRIHVGAQALLPSGLGDRAPALSSSEKFSWIIEVKDLRLSS